MRVEGQPARLEMWEAEAFQQLLGGGQHIVSVRAVTIKFSIPSLNFQERDAKGRFMVPFENSVNESMIRTTYLI